jgi:hypothetical protein
LILDVTDGPLALWRNKIVLSVHHEGAGAMPKERKIMTDRLVHDILFGLIGTPAMMTSSAEYWLRQKLAPGHCHPRLMCILFCSARASAFPEPGKVRGAKAEHFLCVMQLRRTNSASAL